MTSHVAAQCSSDKTISKRKPSWWASVSDKHYHVTKSSFVRGQDVEGSLASDGLGDTTPDGLDQPVLVEALAS